MKRSLGAAILAAALALSFTPAASAGGCRCGKAHAKVWKKLGVSDEAKAKLAELHKAEHAAKDEFHAQWKAKNDELHGLLAAETLDQAKIDAAAGELANLKSARVKAKVDHKAKVAAALTAEQRAKHFQGKGNACGCKKHKNCKCKKHQAKKKACACGK